MYPHPENQAIFQQVVDSGEPYSAYEKPFEYPDQPGRGITYWNWSLQPVKAPNGMVEGVVLSLIDVTERKHAQDELHRTNEELEWRVQVRTQELKVANLELEEEIIERKKAEIQIKKSEEKYRSLFNNMSEGFGLHKIILDQDGRPCDYRFLELNDAFERLTGISRGKALGKTIKEILPDIETIWIEAYGQVALTGQPVHFVNYSPALKKWYEIYCYSPRKYQFAVLFFDVTERKQAEEQLQYQAALLSNVNDAIIASDAQYRLTAWNSAAESLYGWKAEEVIGCNGLDIIQTEWSDIDADAMRRAISETGRWRGEATQKRKDGTRFPVEVSSIGLHDGVGQILGYVSVNRDITDRKHTEEVLRQSQLDLRRAQEVGQIGSWRLDVRRNELAWSDENYRLFGISKGTALSYETFLAAIYPEDRSYVDEKWNLALKGAPYDIEHRIVVGHEIKWVREKAYLEFDQDRKLQGGFGITQDITERKKAEQALLASESKYRNLFENMTEEVHFWQLVRDERGCILTWRLVDANPPTLKSWDRGRIDEIREKTADEIFGPGATDHYMPVVQKIMTEGVPHSYEDYFPNLDKYFRFTSVPLGDYFITTGADITSIKKAEQVLRASHDELEMRVAARTKELSDEIAERRNVERQLRIQTTAMEAAADGIVITDPDGFILWVNPALIALSGYEENELVGQHMRLFKSGRHGEEFYRQMWAAILAGQKWQGEITNCHKDGSLYIEEQTIAPVRGESGKISHFIAIKHDITRQKQAEAELARRNKELQILSENEHKQRQLAETLRASAQALTQSLDLDTVIHTLLKHLRALVLADTASAIFQGGESFLEVRAVDGYEDWTDPAQLLSIKIEIETSALFQRLLSTRRTLLITDTDEEPDWVAYPGTELIHNRMYLPVLIEDRLIGVIGLGKVEVGYFSEEHVQWAEALTGQAAVAIQNAWLFEQVRAGRERLQFLSRRLVEVQESERRYIARELHDHASQNLTSLMLGLGTVEKEADNPEFVRTRTAELKTMTDHVLEDLHRLAINLRPASLDHLGLTPALEQLIKAFRQDSDLDIKLKTVGFSEDERLPQDIETTLYRVVQEALTNVVRHARASHVDVVLERRGDVLLVIVEDDGKGFDFSLVKREGHLGLLGIQERAEMLGGTLTVESKPGSGTTLFVEVPYANPYITRR